MAISVGSVVAVKNLSSGGVAGAGYAVQGPVFGVVNSGAGPFEVQWNCGGVPASGLVAGVLDEITNGDGTIAAALVGRRVKSSSPAGQTNWAQGLCVAVYKRSGSDYALVVTDQGTYLEPLASTVSAA